jgi:hypothetical protein
MRRNVIAACAALAVAAAVSALPIGGATAVERAAPRAATATITRNLKAFHGLGTWVDAYDFSREFGGTMSSAVIDTMAARGVKTIYLQAAKESPKFPGNLLSPDRLAAWLTRAHARGMKVVAWYLPTFTNLARDWQHLNALIYFKANNHTFDAIGMDIESKAVRSAKDRSARLVALSQKLRKTVQYRPLQAIVLPPVVTDIINTSYWPGFPWHQIAPLYDVWTPMGYWTNRTTASGWRDAHRYTYENIRLMRRDLGRPTAVVHAAGGIGDTSTITDINGFAKAAKEQKAIGGSLYDYATTSAAAWPALRTVPT